MKKGVTLISFLESVEFLKTHSIAYFRSVTTSIKYMFIIWIDQIKKIYSYLKELESKEFLQLFRVEK